MKQKTEFRLAITRRSREAAAILAGSLRSALAFLLILTVQLTWLTHHVTAQARPNDKSVELISILREAEKLAKDKSVRAEVTQAIEILTANGRITAGGDAAFPGIGSPRVHDIVGRILDDSRGESPDFQKKITEALKLVQDNSATRDVGANDKGAGSNTAGASEATQTQRPGEKISTVVQEGLRQAEKDSSARAEARRKAFEAERARFEPTSTALAEMLKAANVDLDGNLAASKQFVEMPPEKINQGEVDRVNKKFAESIRTAIAKAVGVTGLGDILQGTQPWQPTTGAGQPNQGNDNGNGGPQVASCCSTNRFEPPFEGLFTEGNLGARSIRPGETRQLNPNVRSSIATAPHRLEASSRRFTVSANARHVSVTVTLGTNWVIGLSGLGYAHVWLGLDMNVSNIEGAVVCSAPHLEQDNQWTWAGGYLTLSDHRPGPSISRTCVFDRGADDPTEYAANVSASTDGTFFGFAGGYGNYYVELGPVDVTTCP